MPPTVQHLTELGPASARFVRHLAKRTRPTYLVPAPRGRYAVVDACGAGFCRSKFTLNAETLRALYRTGLIAYGERVDFDDVIGRRWREDNYGEPVELTDVGWELVGGRTEEAIR